MRKMKQHLKRLAFNIAWFYWGFLFFIYFTFRLQHKQNKKIKNLSIYNSIFSIYNIFPCRPLERMKYRTSSTWKKKKEVWHRLNLQKKVRFEPSPSLKKRKHDLDPVSWIKKGAARGGHDMSKSVPSLSSWKCLMSFCKPFLAQGSPPPPIRFAFDIIFKKMYNICQAM